MTTTTTKEQVINNEAGFRPQVAEYLAQFHSKFGPDYLMIGIIGSQSSGKSTLLNALFGTDFSVMNVNAQRKQTTKGIWISAKPEHNLFVMDIEGADSRERWQDKGAMEKKTALFGLVVCNLLIVNLWLTEIGRFSAANYDIIKLIFEMNLQYFKKDAPKKLLFIIRDFTPDENFDNLKNILITDVNRLWSEIKKPAGCEGLELGELIAVDVLALRHFIHLRPGFDEDVAKLRGRLSSSAPDYLMAKYNTRNVPVDGLYMFMKQIWEVISSNKDINIPNEKIVVSTFRCNEIKKEILEALKPQMDALGKNIQADPAFSLREAYRNLVTTATTEFQNKTQYYEQSVAKEAEADLIKQISAQFVGLFEIENTRMSRGLIAQLESELKALTTGDYELKDVIASIAVKKNTIKQQYFDFVEGFGFEKSMRDDRVKLFGLQVAKLISTFVTNSTSIVLINWRKNILSDLDKKIQETYKTLNADTWRKFNDHLTQAAASFRGKMQEIMRGSEEGKMMFTEDLINAQELEMLQSVKGDLRLRRNLITYSMIEAFNFLFNTTAEGTRRNWKTLEDQQIDDHFASIKKRFEKSYEFLSSSVGLDIDNEEVFTKEETIKMRDLFDAKTSEMLESAFNQKYNRNTLQRVPPWLWVALAYFMHDNVYRWAKNPWFFVVLIIAIAIGVGIYVTGSLDVIIMRLRQAEGIFKDYYMRIVHKVPIKVVASESAKLFAETGATSLTKDPDPTQTVPEEKRFE